MSVGRRRVTLPLWVLLACGHNTWCCVRYARVHACTDIINLASTSKWSIRGPTICGLVPQCLLEPPHAYAVPHLQMHSSDQLGHRAEMLLACMLMHAFCLIVPLLTFWCVPLCVPDLCSMEVMPKNVVETLLATRVLRFDDCSTSGCHRPSGDGTPRALTPMGSMGGHSDQAPGPSRLMRSVSSVNPTTLSRTSMAASGQAGNSRSSSPNLSLTHATTSVHEAAAHAAAAAASSAIAAANAAGRWLQAFPKHMQQQQQQQQQPDYNSDSGAMLNSSHSADLSTLVTRALSTTGPAFGQARPKSTGSVHRSRVTISANVVTLDGNGNGKAPRSDPSAEAAGGHADPVSVSAPLKRLRVVVNPAEPDVHFQLPDLTAAGTDHPTLDPVHFSRPTTTNNTDNKNSCNADNAHHVFNKPLVVSSRRSLPSTPAAADAAARGEHVRFGAAPAGLPFHFSPSHARPHRRASAVMLRSSSMVAAGSVNEAAALMQAEREAWFSSTFQQPLSRGRMLRAGKGAGGSARGSLDVSVLPLSPAMSHVTSRGAGAGSDTRASKRSTRTSGGSSRHIRHTSDPAAGADGARSSRGSGGTRVLEQQQEEGQHQQEALGALQEPGLEQAVMGQQGHSEASLKDDMHDHDASDQHQHEEHEEEQGGWSFGLPLALDFYEEAPCVSVAFVVSAIRVV